MRRRRPKTASATVTWQQIANSTGYKVFFGTKSKSYPYVRDVGANLHCTIPTLSVGITYYFAAKAYNANGESPYSNEVMHRT